MVFVPKEDLRGYRAPAQCENGNILRYLTMKIKREQRPMKFWTVVCSVIAGSGIISILRQPMQYQFGTMLMRVILVIVSVFCIIGIRKSSSYKMNLLRQAKVLNYKVMDCKVYNVSFNMGLNSKAIVKIYNSIGQYCADNFLIDIESAQICQSDHEKQFLLFNCNDCYELISDKRLEVE